MRLYDETCLALCEGQYLDIATSESDELMTRRRLLRHDRAQDRGAHRRVHRGRRAAGDRRRRGHRPLSRLRLGARHRLPAQRRPAGHLGRRTGDRQGRRRTSPIARRPCRSSTPSSTPGRRTARGSSSCTPSASRPTTRSPRSWPSSSGSGPASTPATRPAAIATRRSRELDAAGVVAPVGPRPPRGDHRRGHRRLTRGRPRGRGTADREAEGVAPPVAVGVGHHRAAGHELVVLRVIGVGGGPGRDAARRRRVS